MHQQTSKPSETHRPKGPSLPAKFEKAEEKLCKECKGSMGKGVNSVLMKDGLCKACSVKKTDQKSPRGRDVVPEGELKEKMKEADEHTGPLKPIVKK